jgi:hypothetical protein
MDELKTNFSYIRGGPTGELDEGETASRKYEKTLFKKILKPARAFTSCQMVLKELMAQNNYFDSYIS